MASAAGQKPLILTAAEADHQRIERGPKPMPGWRGPIKAPMGRSNGPIVYAVAALILLAVGYLLFSGNWNTMMVFPQSLKQCLRRISIPPLLRHRTNSAAC